MNKKRLQALWRQARSITIMQGVSRKLSAIVAEHTIDQGEAL
jgi:alkylation response protein AidB-like acyl-CoA dehydrogenase